MNIADLIEAIERFFLDIIGTILPGGAAAFLVWEFSGSPSNIASFIAVPPMRQFDWIIILGLCYVLGHAVISLGQVLISKIIDPFLGLIKKNHLAAKILPPHCKAEADLLQSIAKSDAFKILRRQLSDDSEPDNNNWGPIVHSVRSMALTIVSDEKHIVYRFMFISLLNLGMASVLACFLVYIAIFEILLVAGIIQSSVPLNFSHIILLLGLTFLFLERYYSFYGRAMRVPFPMAVAKLQSDRFRTAPVGKPQSICEKSQTIVNEKPMVYLAGGFHSGWQDCIIKDNPSIQFLDPRNHGLNNRSAYTMWDLNAIEQSDIVFAYLERGNPGGYALCTEIGYAKALNKKIILIDEWIGSDEPTSRYLDMVRQCADVSFGKFNEGRNYLASLIVGGR